MKCQYQDEHVRVCHMQATRLTVFCHYHLKVHTGLTERTHDYLSDTEIDSLFSGRRRNDGRRLDHYTK